VYAKWTRFFVWPHDVVAFVQHSMMELADSVPRHHSVDFGVWMRDVNAVVRRVSMESAVVAVSRHCWHDRVVDSCVVSHDVDANVRYSSMR
jgi:hypothetical protein